MSMQDEIMKTADILRQGGIILYPTDTIWGIGCSALNEKAVRRIFSIKERDENKAMLILLDKQENLSLYIKDIPEITRQIIKTSTKPLTIIYPDAYNVAPSLIAKDGSIGIRITSDIFCFELIRQIGAPLVSTSANKSGQAAPASFAEISDYIKNKVDYIVNWRQDENFKNEPSGLIKVDRGGSFKILRN